MRLITFEVGGRQALGALLPGDLVLDLSAAAAAKAPERAAWFADMLGFIAAGQAARELAERWVAGPPAAFVHPAAALRWKSPLPVPAQIRDFANYERHVLQAIASSVRLRAAATADPEAAFEKARAGGLLQIPAVWYQQPLYYKGNRFSVIGHDEQVIWPDYSEKLDYELELGVVIGGPAKNLREESALEAVFGYTIYNDFSARDAQALETQFRMGPAKGKDFDTGNSLGPCIVTRDEIPDPDALAMIARVNGVEKVRTISGGAQHSIQRCLAHVSRSETLYPGEVFGMGTVGDGCGYESLTFLSPGDVVELEIEGIGVLRNTLTPTPLPPGEGLLPRGRS